jgi:hypothetical protein
MRNCPGVQPRRSYSRLHAIIEDSASFANSADRFANNFASDKRLAFDATLWCPYRVRAKARYGIAPRGFCFSLTSRTKMLFDYLKENQTKRRRQNGPVSRASA